MAALNRALGHRRVEPEQLIIHTDQGSQYRASDYRKLLRKHDISCSMPAGNRGDHDAAHINNVTQRLGGAALMTTQIISVIRASR